jgi:hypothetical protein
MCRNVIVMDPLLAVRETPFDLPGTKLRTQNREPHSDECPGEAVHANLGNRFSQCCLDIPIERRLEIRADAIFHPELPQDIELWGQKLVDLLMQEDHRLILRRSSC